MEYLGTLLKDTREKKGISLDDAHRSTKIPKEIIDNIETDRISTINPVYLKGYLKIYSKYLGLEVNSVLEAYKNILPKQDNISTSYAQFKKEKQKIIVFPQFNFRLYLNIIIVLSLSLFLFIFITHIISNKKIKSASGVSDRGDLSKKRLASPKKTERVISSQVQKEVKTNKSANIKLAIKARESTYLQIKADNEFVFRGKLRKGQTENWTAKETIELSIGSAGSVDLEVNGKPLPSLGKRNQPIKNMIISHDGSIQIK